MNIRLVIAFAAAHNLNVNDLVALINAATEDPEITAQRATTKGIKGLAEWIITGRVL